MAYLPAFLSLYDAASKHCRHSGQCQLLLVGIVLHSPCSPQAGMNGVDWSRAGRAALNWGSPHARLQNCADDPGYVG